MKAFLTLLALSTFSAEAAVLVLTEYDQTKLAHFLRKLPKGIVTSDEDHFTGKRRVRTVFPKKNEAMKISCYSDFYNDSTVPSHSECAFEIDINHQSIEKNYDEVRLADSSGSIAQAMHSIMPHGSETRSFRAGNFEEGTDFNGKKTLIFDFLFECSKTACLYRFAEKKIQ